MEDDDEDDEERRLNHGRYAVADEDLPMMIKRSIERDNYSSFGGGYTDEGNVSREDDEKDEEESLDDFDMDVDGMGQAVTAPPPPATVA